MIYAPELGQQAEPRIFYTEHNFRSSYTVAWRVEDDATARAVLCKLRIRPSDVYSVPQGKHLIADRMGAEVFVGGITSAAHRKLMEVDVAAQRVLLD